VLLLLAITHSLLNPPLKGDRIENPITPSFHCNFSLKLSTLVAFLFLRHGRLTPHLFQPSIADKNEIRKLVANHFLPDHEVLQWRPTVGEDIQTPNTNKIVVFASFFLHGFGLLACNFLRGPLNHYRIKLVHLNPNSILQISVFVHLCEAYLGISPNFPLFKNDFS
jgi:hypothetical protein